MASGLTGKHRPALSHAAAATGEQLHLDTCEVYCTLCTKPCFDQLPLETWRKPLLNTVFEPLAIGSCLAFLSESFPVGYKCLGNHNCTHPQRPHLLVLSCELIPQFLRRWMWKLKTLRDHSTSHFLRLKALNRRASKLTRHSFQIHFQN